jgi:uncharacterized protein YbjT (DUF2867 family)
MKLTVIGGTGLIGSQVVQKLTAAGHQAVPAALSTGLDLITGQGLDQALEGAEVVVNVANSPTFDEASLGFFRTSMTNLLAAGERAGVRHQVILSIVGVDQVPQLVYYRAKTLQENLLRHGPTPYSIVRATQFFEFMNTLVSETSDDTTVRLPSTRLQPIASADVADAVVDVAAGTPLRGIRNGAGPDVFPSANSARSPWPHSRTTGPSSLTTRPAPSRAPPATCSPQAPTHTWHPPTTKTGSRPPGNRVTGATPGCDTAGDVDPLRLWHSLTAIPQPPRTLEIVKHQLCAVRRRHQATKPRSNRQ